MSSMTNLTYGSASMRATVDDDGLMQLDFHGPVTSAVLQCGKRDVLAIDEPSYAYVIQLSRCTFAAPVDDLYRLVCDQPNGAVLRGPTAYVVSESCLALFQRHCYDMIDVGLVRVTFLSLPKARAWAQRKACVLRASQPARALSRESAAVGSLLRGWPAEPALAP